MLALALTLALPPPVSRAAAPPPSVCDARADLEAGLDSIRALMRRRQWRGASTALAALFESHAGSDLARGKRLELEEMARLLAFWSQHPEPNPKELVGGEIVVFDRQTDTVRLRYDATRVLAARAKQATSKRPEIRVPLLEGAPANESAPPFPDFEQSGPLTLHPLQFNGPYGAEVRAEMTAASDGPLHLFFLLDDDEFCWATIASTCTLHHKASGAEKPRELARAQLKPLWTKKPYTIAAQVGEGTIAIRIDGKLAISAEKPKGRFGWFGFVTSQRVRAVTLSGKSYGQWLDALVDAAVEADRKAFDARWDPKQALPAWLWARAKVAARDEGAEHAAIELLQAGVRKDVAERWSAMTKASDYSGALKYLDALDDDALKPLARAWMRAQMLARLERLDEARGAVDIVCAAAPTHRESRRLLTAIAMRTEAPDTALAEARTFVGDFPDDAGGRAMLARVLLRQGAFQDALRTAETALAEGLDSAVLEPLAKQMQRAFAGPIWRATQRFETKHYAIASDMDRDTCVQIGNVLDEAHALFAKTLGPLPSGRPRMRVFVFSGKQAYFDYCEDLVGDPLSRTQGMFAPELAQLLFWNAQDREEFLNTARHEAFHQYVHALVPEMPLWLNEGLAQYFETLRREKGALAVGGVPGGARATLAKLGDWPKLEQLFAASRATFYGKEMRTWYAVAWCTLHALAHGVADDRKLFDALLARLGRGIDGSVAVRETFEDVDLDALLERVQAHARKL